VEAEVSIQNGLRADEMFLFGNVLKTLKGKGDKKKVMDYLTKQLID